MKVLRLFVPLILLLSACGASDPVPTSQPTGTLAQATAQPVMTDTAAATATASATLTLAATATDRPTATDDATATPAATATITLSPTPTLTFTPAPTSTPTLTPTPDYPDVTVNQQANCRYGPGTAYLYRWGLYPGDKAEVHGRNWSGTWYWIKPENLDSHCWASEIVFDVEGDPMTMPVIPPRLPKTTFAGPPGNVQAVRDGGTVIVTWDPVILSEDKRRGYLLEVTICQNGALVPLIVRSDDTRYAFEDSTECSGESGGLLYTAEKHGYSDPVQIPWP